MKASDIIAVLPELILLVAACAILLVEPFLKPRPQRTRRRRLRRDAARPDRHHGHRLAGLVGSVVVSLVLLGRDPHGLRRHAGPRRLGHLLQGAVRHRRGLLTVLMSAGYLEAHRRHLGEYYALLLFAVIGLDLMAAARDFILFYVAFELMSISSYLLAAYFRYRVRSNESSLKYFLTGSFASAIMLYGISLVYGETGATNYHGHRRRRWAAQGGSGGGAVRRSSHRRSAWPSRSRRRPSTCGPPTSTRARPPRSPAFFSAGPKTGGLRGDHRGLRPGLPGRGRTSGASSSSCSSIVTMLVGNLFALVQTNVKRMLAYSSIAHAGYLLGGRGGHGLERQHLPGPGRADLPDGLHVHEPGRVRGAGLSQDADARTSSTTRSSSSPDWAGARPGRRCCCRCSCCRSPASRARRASSASSTCSAAWSGPISSWLAVIGVVLSAVSAYYYLRVIVYMFFREPEEEFALRASDLGEHGGRSRHHRRGHPGHRHRAVLAVGRRGERLRHAVQLTARAAPARSRRPAPRRAAR